MKVRIDVHAIRHNLKALRLAWGKPLVFMCKADAYGHGLRRVAREITADCYGVATENEGVLVRSYTKAPVLITAPKKSEAALCRRYDLIPLIGSFSYAEEAVRLGLKRCHIKVDSGMHRLGVSSPKEAARLAEKLLNGGVRVEGVCTHYKSGEEDTIDEQNRRFDRAVAAVRQSAAWKGQNGKIITHVTAVGAEKASAYDLLRVGLSSYGYHTGASIGTPLEKSMRIESEILSVKRIKKGMTLGYAGAFRAAKDLTACTVLGGYADGVERSEVGRTVLCGGRRARIAAVCMDTFEMVTERVDLKAGQRVIIMTDTIDANYIAKFRKTIPYEVLVGFDRPRAEYIYDG